MCVTMEQTTHNPNGPDTVPIKNADGTYTVLTYAWSPDYAIMNEKLGTPRRL